MRSYARASEVALRLEIADGATAMVIKGDRTRLSQTFCNILHNAIKFSPHGSQVQVRCDVSESEATVRITDQGEGISPEFLPYVFERFRQADASRTRSHGGLGLGLALVKSFVAAHGGTIEAASDGVGKGSVFVVKLPRAAASRTADGRSASGYALEKKENRLRILIVEDQPDTLEMLAAQFQVRGYETLACDSAAHALQLAEREHFDLLISDIAMPGMDGLQLIRSLRQMKGLGETPAIALTGYASPKDAEAAIAAGFNMHFAKPVEPLELSVAVEKLLDTYQNREL